MGHHRNPSADMQDEQRRSNCVADTDPRAHRQPMAERRNRRPHALELQALNGPGLPLTIITSPTTISTAGTGEPVEVSASCFFIKALRQPNSWDGEIPSRRASAETFTPGSKAAATACALNSSDQRRRSPTGAPSKRSITASTNCKLPVAGMGVELVVDMEPRRQTNANSLSQISHAAAPTGFPCRLRRLLNPRRKA